MNKKNLIKALIIIILSIAFLLNSWWCIFAINDYAPPQRAIWGIVILLFYIVSSCATVVI